ncbi:bifunctional phosphoribosylaminoimidazole carboxylase/phosphoribosylaminoimidazole succinocarboxamide synthetase [Rissa tridactyla]|uniref:bifunctional phosphoribosylaminoimidazole carboxylase/phosphoribosylaminoimidazole succinocarboxamide synthetase n=1 Tax=Rissa tridactyla TaxID=75485 RepID=UPI0023BA7C60|nr:bifunctional phosphoribosylaminoimidazole carboxylase/phosphoribosylaminoimidazole succinocarboxamide synthetase [Rissa tridactyla]
MESGAGKHWTEEEVKALLSVWSEKNIRKQLHGTLRNKGIFIYIAKRLQELGVCRDWKQCRAKYKNLKYEYRTVKYAHNSGDVTKTMKFFHDLDAILRYEPVTQLAAEENGRCSATETQPNTSPTTESTQGKITVSLEDDEDAPGDPLLFMSHVRPVQLGNPCLCLSPTPRDAGHATAAIEASKTPVFIPTVANEGGKHWTVNEVRALICVWSDKTIQQQLEGTVRNKRIFEQVAARLQKFGIDRDWKQCRTKYKNLKHEYKSVKSAQDSGISSKSMKFFNELDAILGHSTMEQASKSDNDESERPPEWTEAKSEKDSIEMPGDTGEEDSVSNMSEELRVADIKKVSDSDDVTVNTSPENLAALHIAKETAMTKILEDDGDFASSTPAAPEATQIKKETIDIDDDSISTTSEDRSCTPVAKRIVGTDNHIPLEETQNHFKVITVNDTGAGKHWSDNEVRALINIWSDEKIQQMLEGATRNKEIFEEIARRLMKRGIDRDWKQCRTKYKNLKYEYRALQKENEHLGNPRRKMRFYDEVDCILRRQPLGPSGWGCESSSLLSVSVGDITANTGSLGIKRKTWTDEVSPVPLKKSASENTILHFQKLLTERVHTVTEGKKLLLERLCKQEEMQDLNRTQLYADPSAIQQVGLMNFLQNYPTSPRVMTWGTSSSVGQAPEAMQPNTPHSSRMPSSSSSMAPAARGGRRPRSRSRCRPRCGGSRAQPPVPAAAPAAAMAPAASDLKLGKKVNEGKTKEVYELPDMPGCVLMQSKDQITAGNAARKDRMEGKAAISNTTTSCVFQLLQEAGIKTAFVRKQSDTAFIAAHCEMIPIEWVCRRIATGSFLKRNPGVKEGYKFYPPKIEMFYKDDANNDPQWSEEQLIEAKFCFGGLTIGQTEVDIMARSTQAIFEILEKSWQPQNCTLVDLKIEFGVNILTKEIVLADVIDNDSWRLWPSGDRSQQKDKQSYRDLKEVTPEALQMVKRNFEWVAERVELLLKTKSQGRVVVLMGSPSDLSHCEKIKKACATFGIPCELRVTSAHKGPDETLRIKAEYEGDGIPTVFVAVAGRSNGLGPVMSGNTAYPVVNCPPLSADWGTQDVWSSLRLPSGLSCPTTLSPEGAAQFAAQIFGLNNHLVWAKLRSNMLNTWISLKQADKKLRECTL